MRQFAGHVTCGHGAIRKGNGGAPDVFDAKARFRAAEARGGLQSVQTGQGRGCSEGGSEQPVSAGKHGVMVTGADGCHGFPFDRRLPEKVRARPVFIVKAGVLKMLRDPFLHFPRATLCGLLAACGISVWMANLEVDTEMNDLLSGDQRNCKATILRGRC